ncbi:hypothetical protein LCGC14_0328770 [marine sediment metagenome]|uniref:Uncharacterized protein n=2 Tax=root TaxID=1 RepID=A0A0F9TZU4_9ZZZZ
MRFTERKLPIMRLPATVAILFTLSACVSGGDELDVLRLTAPEDDAHCRSLLIQPGELVYAQCRLALRKTYLTDYGTRKATIEQAYGPVSETLDQALRADAFCNYDESVKASVESQDETAAAYLAYANCETTRQRLQDEIMASTGADGAAFVQEEQPRIIQQNIRAVREAKAVINGPMTADATL